MGRLEPLRTQYVRYLKLSLQSFSESVSGGLAGFPDSEPGLARILKAAVGRDPAKTLSCFSAPNVGAALHCVQNIERWPHWASKIEAAMRESAPNLLLELAVRGLLPEGRVRWMHGAPALSSPSIGVALSAGGAAGWVFENGAVHAVDGLGEGPAVRLSARSLARGRQTVKGFRSELAFIPLEGTIQLALVDRNPIAETEAHPEKTGNALNMGGRSEDDWRSGLKTALEWIREQMPGLFDEMDLILRQVVPVGYHREIHYSASFREAIGTIYMTLHPSVLTMSEALIHEFHHNKLNLLSYSDDIINNAFQPLYPSPVRPDPRPLWGVLLAVHAFLPVSVFYRKLRDARHPASNGPDFAKRLDEIDRKNAEGMETLRRHGEWTPLGRELFGELEALNAGHLKERSAAGLATESTAAHEP